MGDEIGPRRPLAGVAAFVFHVGCIFTVFAAAGLIVSGTWASHHWPYRQDRHLFEYMGQRILDGGTIYQSCWDNKPPLVPWINAGVLAVSDSTEAISVAAGSAAAIATAALALASWSWFGPGIACVMTLLAAGTFSLRYYDGCTNGTELYAAMFDSIAAALIVVSWKARTKRSCMLMLAAGLAFACAFACKQNQVAGPIATGIVLLLMAIRRRDERSVTLGKLASLTLGTVGGLFVFACILYRQDALSDAVYAIFSSNKLFVSDGLSWWVPGPTIIGVLAEQAAPLDPLIWLAVIGVVATFAGMLSARCDVARCECDRSLPGSVVGLMTLWFAFAAYSVMWGGCHLTRYWHICFVPLFWLAAQACFWGRQAIAEATPTGRTVLIIAGLTAAWLVAKPSIVRQANDLASAYYYATSDSELARVRQVAGAVEKRTCPEDFIYVWGYEPGIYRFSHRAAPCRFAELCKVEMLGAPAGFMVEEVIAALNCTPPRLIAVRKTDEKSISAGYWSRSDVAGLRDLLDTDYRREAELCGYVLYERTDVASKPTD